MTQQSYGGIQFPGDAPRPRDLMQPIEADYFNLMDAAGDPAGALLVLVDTARQPVRAELHLPEDVSDDEAAAALRQAQHLLQDRYRGPESLKLTVSFLRSDTMDVALPAGAPRAPVVSGGTRAVAAEPQRNLWPYVGLGLAAIAVIALIWLGMRWLRGGETTADTGAGDTAALETPAADAGAAEAPAAAETAPASLGLPPSANADPNIVVGVRVRMKEGRDQALLGEPGRGDTAVGTLAGNTEALVVGGPEMRQGNSDTIVWWLLQLDDGTEAWAAANSSTEALLLPAD
jgi:hypothetical protein